MKRLFPSFRSACKHYQQTNPAVSYDEIVSFVRKAVKVGEIIIGKIAK